jgi:hypothetical protein
VDFTLINPQPKYQPVKLIEPSPPGYIYVAPQWSHLLDGSRDRVAARTSRRCWRA